MTQIDSIVHGVTHGKSQSQRAGNKKRVFALFGAVPRCSQVFFSPRTIYAEVVEGEGEAQSWRLRVLR